jgi:hypothetical protein
LYSHWFELAYPQPVQRQKYLRSLIERSAISHANWRLAHLLIEKQLGALVVTPNFDDLLARALSLFGHPAVVCDHPRTVERINPESSDIQILHVHGSYLFYDCCNLRGEIEDRAKPEPNSMSSALDQVLSRRCPLVIGYGGWDGDVIMSALQRRLQLPLPVNLYWFCYHRDEAQSLPPWLRNHAQVRLVAPSASEKHGVGSTGVAPSDSAGSSSARPASTEATTLSAQRVLDALIRAFKLDAPLLTRDPLRFLADHLEASLPAENPAEPDVYALVSVVSRIRLASGQTVVPDVLESLRDAVRRSAYREGLDYAARLLQSLPTNRLAEFAESAWSVATGLNDDSRDKVKGYTW